MVRFILLLTDPGNRDGTQKTKLNTKLSSTIMVFDVLLFFFALMESSGYGKSYFVQRLGPIDKKITSRDLSK